MNNRPRMTLTLSEAVKISGVGPIVIGQIASSGSTLPGLTDLGDGLPGWRGAEAVAQVLEWAALVANPRRLATTQAPAPRPRPKSKGQSTAHAKKGSTR